jgi:DMSO/TMAO reductase YedYZ molybdopterin-dependent catalytic subunit
MRLLKSLLLFFSTLTAGVMIEAATPGASSPVILSGAVARPGPVDAALAQGLPRYRRLVKAAGADGHYRCTIEVEGYALRDLLDRAEVKKKVDDGFDRPLDTFITIKGREAEALISYGEVFLAADGGPLLANSARLILPHHHPPLDAGDNDPTVFKSAAERDRVNVQSCASCHTESKLLPLSLPKGWLLVVPEDPFGGRFVEGVTEVEVHQVGIAIKAVPKSAGTAVVEVPVLVGPDSKQSPLTVERYQQLASQSWSDATFGAGMGFHGFYTWQGVDLGSLLRPLVPPTSDPRNVWVLVTAADGYRCVFSGSEVFSAPEGKGVMLAIRKNGEPLGPGSGRYNIVSKTDFYIDRSVKMVQEIRVGLPQ